MKSGSDVPSSQTFDLRIERGTCYCLNNSDGSDDSLFSPPVGTGVWYQPREISADVYEMPSVSGTLSYGIKDSGATWNPNGNTGWGMDSGDASAFQGDAAYVAATAIIGSPPDGTYTPAAMIGPNSTDYAP